MSTQHDPNRPFAKLENGLIIDLTYLFGRSKNSIQGFFDAVQTKGYVTEVVEIKGEHHYVAHPFHTIVEIGIPDSALL